MAGQYGMLVRDTFKKKKEEFAQGIGAEKEASLSKAKQSSMAQGIRGPIASALEQRAVRQAGEAGAKGMSALQGQEAQAQVQAGQMDIQQQQAEKQAEQEFWSGIWQGLGTLVSPIATAGISKVANTLFPSNITDMTDEEIEADMNNLIKTINS
jgi:hypothetical protein